jgi:hypothetical protein
VAFEADIIKLTPPLPSPLGFSLSFPTTFAVMERLEGFTTLLVGLSPSSLLHDIKLSSAKRVMVLIWDKKRDI